MIFCDISTISSLQNKTMQPAFRSSEVGIWILNWYPLLNSTTKPQNECRTFNKWNFYSLRWLQSALGYLKIDDKSTSFSFRTNSCAAEVRVAGVGTVIGIDRGHYKDDITVESKMAIYDILRYPPYHYQIWLSITRCRRSSSHSIGMRLLKNRGRIAED